MLVYQREGLNEHEDESVGEAREQREHQDNGLGQEHLKWTNPGEEHLLGRESVTERHQLIWPPDIGAGILLSPLLRNAVHHNGGSRFGDRSKV